ncbi:hypothetical protein KP509_22G044700 [Ceratopteris richardii]|uniref:Uncharacterized protein n=1 Tax=Ceratopteris richardii TaxID=49495 RepID=A0A8T2S7U2_CERRI|nr:hypothetical protein KP509_22G044700 [Ceratopteris richardii]
MQRPHVSPVVIPEIFVAALMQRPHVSPVVIPEIFGPFKNFSSLVQQPRRGQSEGVDTYFFVAALMQRPHVSPIVIPKLLDAPISYIISKESWPELFLATWEVDTCYISCVLFSTNEPNWYALMQTRGMS